MQAIASYCIYTGQCHIKQDQEKLREAYSPMALYGIIQNAFGVLRGRWQIFGQHIIASVETVEAMTKVAVCLYNFLRQTKCASYCPNGFVDREDRSDRIKAGEKRSNVAGLGSEVGAIAPIRGRRNANQAMHVRNALMNYFVSEAGSAPW